MTETTKNTATMDLFKYTMNTVILIVVLLLLAAFVMVVLTIFSLFVRDYGLTLDIEFPVIRENYIVSFIAVTTSIVSIALPLSINAVSSAKGSQYESDEIKETFFEEPVVSNMWTSLWVLAVLLVSAMFSLSGYLLYNFIVFGLMVWVLFTFRSYMLRVKDYVSDFGKILLEKENKVVEGILKS